MPRRSNSNFDDDREGYPLRRWEMQSERDLTREVRNPVAKKLVGGIESPHRFLIRYTGGSSPGQQRWIRPQRVFQKGTGIYTRAYCEKRRTVRTFDVSRISIIRKEPFVEEPVVASPVSSPRPTSGSSGCLILALGVPAGLVVVRTFSDLIG